jgi:hypothetical protein
MRVPDECPCRSPLNLSPRPITCGNDLAASREPEEPDARLVAPSWAVACHEAGHAVVAHLYGHTVLSIESAVSYKDGRNRPFVARIAGWRVGDCVEEKLAWVLAGPIAELWSHRWIRRPWAEEFLPSIRGIRAARPGTCDTCAAFAVLHVNAPEASDEVLIDAYRAHERRTIDLVCERRDVWRGITAIAKAFQERGHLDPISFAEICKTTGIEFAGLRKEAGITGPSSADDHAVSAVEPSSVHCSAR